MRFAAVILVALAAGALAGCPAAKGNDALSGGDDDGSDGVGGTPNMSPCASDDECELASASCCECPTFASNVRDPASRACDGIACPVPPSCAGNVRAACDPTDHLCVVACVEMACGNSCPDGYAVDPATGCASCACAVPAADGCTADGDCVQTRADCCGCAKGGSDTAVLASEQAAYDRMLNQGLGCPASPQCPDLDQCDPADAPRCVQGACVLTSAQLPADACGRDDLPACGTCMVNRDPAATALGVGVCVP